MTAVQVHGAGRLVAVRAAVLVRGRQRIGSQIRSRPGSAADVGLVRMVVVMVTEMSSTLSFVLAIRRHRRPAELERKQGEQDDCEEAAHGQESSGY